MRAKHLFGDRDHGRPTTLRPPSRNWKLPVWSSSFMTEGVSYPFTMIGTNPQQGQTTTVPTVIVPYRLVFSESGDVLDASVDMVDGIAPLDGVLRSPIFNPAIFRAGSTVLGNTQYGDAMMRGNFWRLLSDTGPGYHVLLGPPDVRPVRTIVVDAQHGFVFDDPSGSRLAVLDISWLDIQVRGVMANPGSNVHPDQLVVHLFPSMVALGPGGSAALGYHDAADLDDSGTQTYIVSSYVSTSDPIFFFAPDTSVLGHEVAEWMADPGILNQAPLWEAPSYPGYCPNPLLEVADPLEFAPQYAITTAGRTYTLPQVAFLPWFSRAHASFSVNRWYTPLNTLPASQPCPDFPIDPYAVQLWSAGGDTLSYVFLDFPGANTFLYGINNRNQVVGFTDSGGSIHSFVAQANFSSGTVDVVASISVPGSAATFAYGISDAGYVVGVYYDQQQIAHGFRFAGGRYTSIDFPGAVSTGALNISNRGNGGEEADIVGGYTDQGGVHHGFVFRGGRFTTVDAPFATSLQVTGIDREGRMVGTYQTNAAPGRDFGFMGRVGQLEAVTHPLNPDGFYFQGVNDKGQAVGLSSDGTGFQEIDNFYTPLFLGDVTALSSINNAGVVAASILANGTFDGVVFLPTASGNHRAEK